MAAAVLALVAIGCGVVGFLGSRSADDADAEAAAIDDAFYDDGPTAADVTAAELGSVATPVLAVRRAPGWLAEPSQDLALAFALAGLVERLPDTSCLVATVDGRPLIDLQPDLALIPASTEKLPTAVAALELLGPDYRFRTTVTASPNALGADGVLTGDLFFVGAGDPLLITEEYVVANDGPDETHTKLIELADAIAAKVTRIEGAVVGDGSRYDAQRYVAAWPPRFVTANQTGPLSALMVDDGYESYPTPLGSRRNATPAASPDAHAAERLTALLVERGVAVSGNPRAGATPGDAVEIAAVESPPLTEILGQMLRNSDNTTAELLVKEMGIAAGGVGSTRDGTIAIADALADDYDTTSISVTDGSGLASENRLTCGLLHELLADEENEELIGDELATAGIDGTLRFRFIEEATLGRIRAKTGTLNQATALAGYADSAGGDTIVFAHIANEPLILRETVALQTELAELLATHPTPFGADEVGPLPPVAAQ